MKRIRIDKLGRIVIPIGFRKELDITTETDLMIACKNRKITIVKAGSYCRLCDKEINQSQTLSICDECIKTIKSCI